MELNFKKVNFSLVFRSNVVIAGTAVVGEQLTCEVFFLLYNILEEKVGASIIADLNPNYFLRRNKLNIQRLSSHKKK